MAYPATKTILAMKDTVRAGHDDQDHRLPVEVGLRLRAGGLGFYSTLSTPRAQIDNLEPKGENYLLEVDNPLVVPVEAKVRLLITAGDVIHAWWVPAFGVKQDAIPGFVRDTWFKADEARHLPRPVRRAVRQGARLHADRRRGEVEGRLRQVGRRAEGQKLAAAADDPNKVWDLKELVARGEKVYAANCAACHQANGKGVAGRVPGARRLARS